MDHGGSRCCRGSLIHLNGMHVQGDGTKRATTAAAQGMPTRGTVIATDINGDRRRVVPRRGDLPVIASTVHRAGKGAQLRCHQTHLEGGGRLTAAPLLRLRVLTCSKCAVNPVGGKDW